jgi:hypothetical protein
MQNTLYAILLRYSVTKYHIVRHIIKIVRRNMDIQKAYIQENGSGTMESEMKDVCDELQIRGIHCELFTRKKLIQQRLKFDKHTLIVGFVDSIFASLKQLGINPPPNNDYPPSLNHLLHRRIWSSTVKQLEDQIYEGYVPVFAKPLKNKKQFTGSVFSSVNDFGTILRNLSIRTPIYCSEVVQWLTEYRIFVIQSEIVGIKLYAGNPNIALELEVVKSAVEILTHTGEATAGYAIDFGVLATGETALVEWNDGFALGSYGLEKSTYTDLLIARWHELVQS